MVAEVQTDACNDAIGIAFRGYWAYSYWPADNFKEAFVIYFAAKRWAPLWATQHIVIKCDNQAAVAMINKGSTASPVAMAWLRDLF